MDIWQILGYVIVVVCNIAAVAKLRAKAVERGKLWLSSGRGAVVVVFALSFLEQLVVGRFEAFTDPVALTEAIRNAWLMAGAAVGGHTTWKTGIEAVQRKKV